MRCDPLLERLRMASRERHVDASTLRDAAAIRSKMMRVRAPYGKLVDVMFSSGARTARPSLSAPTTPRHLLSLAPGPEGPLGPGPSSARVNLRGVMGHHLTNSGGRMPYVYPTSRHTGRTRRAEWPDVCILGS